MPRTSIPLPLAEGQGETILHNSLTVGVPEHYMRYSTLQSIPQAWAGLICSAAHVLQAIAE